MIVRLIGIVIWVLATVIAAAAGVVTLVAMAIGRGGRSLADVSHNPSSRVSGARSVLGLDHIRFVRTGSRLAELLRCPWCRRDTVHVRTGTRFICVNADDHERPSMSH